VLEELERIPDGNVSFQLREYKFETKEFNSVMIKKVVVTTLKTGRDSGYQEG
jgi:Mg2+/Co2+ transporter CorB